MQVRMSCRTARTRTEFIKGQHLTDVRIQIVRVSKHQRIVAAGLHTSRLLADGKFGVQAEVAVFFCGLRLLVNESNVVRTSGNAVLAADAAGIIHGHDVGGWIYVRSACGQTLTQGGSEHCWQDTRTYLQLPGVQSSGDWRSSVMRS